MALEGIVHIASEHRYTPATAAKAVYNITLTASIGHHFIGRRRCCVKSLPMGVVVA